MVESSVVVVLLVGNLLGALIKGLTGFGSAIINLCVWVMCTCAGINAGTLQQAVLTECICSFVLAVPLLVVTRAHVTCDWGLVFSLSLFGALGAPIGAAMLTRLPPRQTEFAVACLVLLVILLNCWQGWRRAQQQKQEQQEADTLPLCCMDAQNDSSHGEAGGAQAVLKPEPTSGTVYKIAPSLAEPGAATLAPSAANTFVHEPAHPPVGSAAGAELLHAGHVQLTTAQVSLLAAAGQETGADSRPPHCSRSSKASLAHSDSGSSTGSSACNSAAGSSAGRGSGGSISGSSIGCICIITSPEEATDALSGGACMQDEKVSLLPRAQKQLLQQHLGSGGLNSGSTYGGKAACGDHTTPAFAASDASGGKCAGAASGGYGSSGGKCCQAVRRWWARLTQPEQMAALQKSLVMGSAAGCAGGVMAGLTGMGGPPVMLMFERLRIPKEVVRGTNAVCNVLQFRIFVYAAMGVFARADLLLYLVVSAGALVGMAAGSLAAAHTNQAMFSRMLMGLMILCCVLMFASSAGLAGPSPEHPAHHTS